MTKPPLADVLSDLRRQAGLTLKKLAGLAGTSVAAIWEYEAGKRTVTREKVEELAAQMGFGPQEVDLALLGVEQRRAAEGPGPPAGPSPAERRALLRAAAAAGRAAGSRMLALLTRRLVARRAGKARRLAGEAYRDLRARPAADPGPPPAGGWSLRAYGLCLELCAQSERAAAADAGQALELAARALAGARLAPRAPGGEAWNRRLEAWAWAHVGNALRVLSRLLAADRAFARALDLWEKGAPADPGVLDEGRLLDLLASLRRAQRRFVEAIELHDRALAATRPAQQGSILLNKANVQEDLEDYEGAIASLERAATLVDGKREPRLLFGILFNRAVALGHLQRHEEAGTLLPKVRKLAASLGNGLDLLRLQWLEARLALGLGQEKRGLALLDRVRGEFAALGMAYDAALAGLELAVLHLGRRRTGEVKALALELAPVFRALEVGRETLASLDLFCQAAARERATVEMARRLLDELRRAGESKEGRGRPGPGPGSPEEGY